MYLHLVELRKLKPSRKEPPHYANRYLFVGCAAGVRSFPRQAASNTRSPRPRESRWGQLRSPGTRILESCKQRGTAARSTIAVSAYGAVFEREPAGRGCRVFLRAAAGIRTSPDGRSKGPVSKRHRIAARSARIFSLVAAPSRLRQGNDRYIGTSQAAFRREDFRCELDRGHRPCRTSRRFSSEEGSRGRAGLVCRKRRQGASCRVVAGSLLSPGKAGFRRGRTGQSPRLSAAERLQRLRTADYAHHSFFGGGHIRARFCPPAHK